MLPIKIFIFLLSIYFGEGVAQSNIPEMKFDFLGENWQNLSLPTTNKKILYSDRGDDFFLGCEATYPIQWNFTGFFSPPEIVKIQAPKRDLTRNTYAINVNIFFIDAENYTNLGSSVRLACEKVGDPEIREEVFLFVKGNNNEVFVRPPKSKSVVVDSKLIPCPTKDPSVTPTLYRRTNGGEERVTGNIRYHLTEGFRSDQVFNGVYTCRQGSSSVTITALVGAALNFPNSDDYQFTPKTNTVRVFTENTIEFECFSKSQKSVRLIPDDNPNVTVSILNQNGRMTAKLSSQVNTKGKTVCVVDSDRVGNNAVNLVMDWSYEFVQTPTLFLNNYEREVDCLSPLQSKMVQTVRCKNTMDCNFMEHCLENVTLCNFKKQKQFFATTQTFCWIQQLRKGFPCASVPYSHLNGLAQCTVAGLVKQWEYFVSLDFLSYGDWHDAPERELLRMDETPAILYTNGTTQFFCTAVAYLFTDSLSFEIEFMNETRILLNGNESIANISNPGAENPRKIDEFNVIGVLDIMLPIDTVGIHCFAPWWNGTGWLTTSRKFETRHLLKPRFTDNDNESPLRRQAFYTGEKNRRLTCNVTGEPQPVYTWYFNKNKKVADEFPELKTSLGSNGEGYLEFPMIQEGSRYTGEYHCQAENTVGRVERSFQVDVSDEPISGKSVIYIIVVIVILIILALVLGMLFIFMRRYNEARELVRSLTDIEIDEFFQGRPELLTNASGNNVEIVDFLPYKNEYEIPLEDLEFDSSEKNVLGSGEFSYVVRGKIISKNRPVALKISKPSADVTLFKSLLSEVKIMIYIGQNDNVMTLVGVCTQAIRHRSIHIATDICDLGSLDIYLRKARPSFANLMNANQEIDLSLLPENATLTTTLDLISFCGQIAKGMEYLASKSVIHADLAARNVLLTADKVAKISDFGLSKKLYESNNYVKKSKSPLPWRWMAIESLTTLTFSTNSDIWAYGVTLFEIFTLGDIPFPNEEWNKEFLNRLASGMRMGRPKYSTQEIYSKIVACWESEPEIRPGFSTLRTFFEQLLRKYQYTGPIPVDDNGPDNGNNGPTLNQSEPLTTTGGPAYYANYNGKENLNRANGIETDPLPRESVVKYADLDHDVYLPINQYVNTPNDQDEKPMELQTIAEKTEEGNNAKPEGSQKHSYVNFG